MLQPFETDGSFEVSAGYYQISGTSLFHQLSARLYGVHSEVADPQKFLPSSRSLAFKKTFFEKTGGYPEWLSDAGEDTLWDYYAKSHPARWAFVSEALVYWKPPDTVAKLIRSYFRYSRGDGEAGASADLYWYKTVEIFWVNFLRLIVIGAGLLLFWIVVIAAIVYAIRWLSSGSTARSTGASEAPIEILKRRYAKGEIDHDEFVARKQELV